METETPELLRAGWTVGWETMWRWMFQPSCACLCFCWWLVISSAYVGGPEAKCCSLSAPVSSAVCICWGSSALWVKISSLSRLRVNIWLNHCVSVRLASLLAGTLIVMIQIQSWEITKREDYFSSFISLNVVQTEKHERAVQRCKARVSHSLW